MKDQKIKGKGEVTMSLYEINQGIMNQLPPYDKESIEKLSAKITQWDMTKHHGVKYYMLLNNDKHYYTIFHYEDSPHNHFNSLGEGIIILLQEMGYSIVSEEILDDHCEIWVKNDTETIAYLLFPYDQGVVTYG